MTKQGTVASSSITIYKVTNLNNGKCYIGQTKTTVSKRFSQHYYDATVCKKQNPFHKAIRKYGRDSFVFCAVVVCDERLSNYYENAFVNLFKSNASNGSGYNVASPLDHCRSIARMQKGENHPMSILDDKKVIEIRSSTFMTHSDASRKFNVSYSNIKNIRGGRTWVHVGGILPAGSYKKDKKTGENHHRCAISDDIRKKIKYDTTTNSSVLAEIYGLSKSSVAAIRGAQPQIKRKRLIDDKIAQYVLDNPDMPNSKLSKELSISAATISRIKTGISFGHLVSKATSEQWSVFFERQKKAVGC